MGTSLPATGGDHEHVIRWYRPDDAAALLDLYEAVWGERRSERWLRWRFAEPPVDVDRPIVVAEADGRIVGAEPCVPYRLSAGGEPFIALQPADWMVHPDYRRRGIFTGMTDHWLDDPRSADAFFNFPSDAIFDTLTEKGWFEVGRVTTWYRVADPVAVASAMDLGTGWAALARALGPLARTYWSVRDRMRSTADGVLTAVQTETGDEVTVSATDGVDADALLACYRDARPDGVHVRRDEAHYEWRYANPRWSTRTYVATDGDEPVAAVLACRRRAGGLTKLTVADVQPLAGQDRPAVRRGLTACLTACRRDNPDAAVLEAAGASLPDALLDAAGFVADHRLPVPGSDRRSTFVARPVGDQPATVGGCDLADVGDWTLAMGERDVA